MNTRILSVIGLVAVVVAFFAINLLVGPSLRSVRLDLTEDKLYTLPVGASNIARDVEEPLTVKLYFSRQLATGIPALMSYAQRVEDTLREFERNSNGGIRLEVIDPEPFTDEELEAAAAGLHGQPAKAAGEMLYFGMVATNSTDGREVIPVFNPADERILNYELARRFYTLSHPNRPKIAIMSGLPIFGDEGNQLTGEQPSPPWQVVAGLQAMYEVEEAPTDGTLISPEVGLLFVVFPRNFSAYAWYAIDQFVMRGGRVIFAVDPHCMNYFPPEAAQNQSALFAADRSADLGPLGQAWGVNLVRGEVVADQVSAVSVPAPDRSGRMVSYVVFLLLTDDSIADDDPVVASLGTMTTQAPGHLAFEEDAQLRSSWIVQTTAESMTIPVEKIKYPDPDALVRDFVPSGSHLPIVTRLTGSLASAFPDGPPPGSAHDGAPHLGATDAPAEFIVLTDVDMLADSAWVRPIQIGGQIIGQQPFADNGSLILNAAENLLGSSDLTSIRASAASVRTFTRVEELQRSAEKQYLAERDRIQAELQAVEQRINALLRGQGDAEVMLTPEIQAELDRARESQAASRKKLREVQHKLNEDVERLDVQMRLINIALVPAAVVAFAVGLAGYSRVRRRLDRAGSAGGKA